MFEAITIAGILAILYSLHLMRQEKRPAPPVENQPQTVRDICRYFEQESTLSH